MNDEIRTVFKDGVEIKYALIRKKVKNVNLRIKSNSEVVVSANRNVSVSFIDSFVIEKSEFILRAFEKFKDYKVQNKNELKLENGENFSYLGEMISLKVTESNLEGVEISSREITLKVKDTEDFKRKERIFNKWIDMKCIEVFSEIALKTYQQFQPLGIRYPDIKIRSMKSRWGSCNITDHKITLNKRLIEYKLEAIEYVVLHEFCHLIHPNHSRDFYMLVERFMPDYKARKASLK